LKQMTKHLRRAKNTIKTSVYKRSAKLRAKGRVEHRGELKSIQNFPKKKGMIKVANQKATTKRLRKRITFGVAARNLSGLKGKEWGRSVRGTKT